MLFHLSYKNVISITGLEFHKKCIEDIISARPAPKIAKYLYEFHIKSMPSVCVLRWGVCVKTLPYGFMAEQNLKTTA